MNYDRLLAKTKTFLSVGGYYNRSNNHVIVDASYKKKPEGSMERLELLSNDFWFHQTITCLLYTSPSPRDRTRSRMPSSA